MNNKVDKIEVTFFQRRPRPGFNFSFEQIFNTVRMHLQNKINHTIVVCPRYNNGIFTKIINIVHAGLHQSGCINHITGEVHFLNLLMHKKRVMLTMHDCRFMQRKKGLAKLLAKYLYIKWPVKRSSVIVSVSETTKKEIVKYTGCDPGKIAVIPVPVNDMCLPLPKQFNSTKPVILQTGTAENKNLDRVAEALAGINCSLVIVGKLSAEQISLLNKYKIEYTNQYNLSQQQMAEQYQACDIVSFVSTFEGFGMPIVEANCVERVVLTSAISSMPEVAGDAACFVDPFDVREIKSGFLKLIGDAAYREQLIMNGRKNKLRFDANSIADAYYRLYKKMAAGC